MKPIEYRAVRILDCTFRDGGYHTNWEFPEDLVRDYVRTLAELPVDAIELGYAGKGPGAGKFANLNNRVVSELRGGSTAMLAVMLDAKDFLGDDAALDARLDLALGPRIAGGIDAVRIAVHFRDAQTCAKLIDALKMRGYRVFLNLMQIDLANGDDVRACHAFVSTINGLEAVYVADSLGSMRTDRVGRLVAGFATACATDVGFHAHDNCGLAIANALGAAFAGATWLDSTVAGMGRGAGNASTEQMLRAVSAACSAAAEDLLQLLVARHFNPLKAKHGWGDNLFYQVGADHGLHPTYVQEVLGDRSLSDVQALRWIRQIPADTAKFDRGILEQARGRALLGRMLVSAKMEQMA